MDRQFSSGSRQAPDPYDQFLEEHNFYRKHTARDSSCLFRVISEQMYDTQMHHLEIRKMCVRYMRKHSKFFEKLVDRDFDAYLDDMSKPKTFGTLIELQALGFLYERNVLIFEPFDLGNYYCNQSRFNHVFRVFYTQERHFDSVFTCDYIKDAALCQAIVYEVLYKEVYKLPDVSYAVEYMLHLPNLESTDYHTEYNAEGYCTRIHLSNGHTFELNLPQETNCILENHKLCHFHYPNFPLLSGDLKRELKIGSTYDKYEKNVICKTAESLLPNKYVSCVRQLLEEGITPFPYKVAKALDSSMYRNIEFDSWNEARKELKLQNWYNGDANFKVGAKCHVKLCKAENNLYTCHIQDIAADKGYCIVYIEQLGEKRLVPYESLTPLPVEQFKPWALPYRFQRQLHKFSSVRLTRHYNYRWKFNGQFSTMHEYCSPMDRLKSDYNNMTIEDIENSAKRADGSDEHCMVDIAHQQHNRRDCYYKLKQYTHLENFRAHSMEYCTMPLSVQHAAQRELELKTNETTTASQTPASTTDTQIKPNSHDVGNRNGINNCGTGGALPETAERSGQQTSCDPLTEYQQLFPIHQCTGMPDDYYCYGYDNGMPQPTPADTAQYIAAANGGNAFYYMCNPAPIPGNYMHPPASGNSLCMQMPPPMPRAHTQPLMVTPNASSGNASYNNNYYHNQRTVKPPNNHGAGVNQNASERSNTAPSGNGRVNWDAKKSFKPTGVDLPADVATLRHFYNLGLEYYQKNVRRQSEELSCDKEDMTKLTEETQLISLDENANNQENKTDSNSNSVKPVANSSGLSNSNTTGNSPHYSTYKSSYHQGQRRFPPRYYSNKDRSNYRSTTPNSQNNSSSTQQSSQRHDNNHRNVFNTKNDNYLTTTPNSSRPNHMPSYNAGHNRINFGRPNLPFAVADPSMHTSPMMMNYDNVSADINQNPNAFNATQNAIFALASPYEFGIDPNVAGHAANNAAAIGAAGVYIQVPYGLYAGGTAPPPGLHPGSFPAFVGPPPLPNMPIHMPPPIAANAFFTASSNADIAENGVSIGAESVHFQCLNYPPPPPNGSQQIPFYYTPSGNTNSNALVSNNPTSQQPQGYWCLPPNNTMPPPIQSCTPADTVGGSTAATVNTGPTKLISRSEKQEHK